MSPVRGLTRHSQPSWESTAHIGYEFVCAASQQIAIHWLPFRPSSSLTRDLQHLRCVVDTFLPSGMYLAGQIVRATNQNKQQEFGTNTTK